MLSSITVEEYFFYEWLIIEKEFNAESFSLLSSKDKENLIKEYQEWEERFMVYTIKEENK
jgi:hypothetical protein